VARLGGSLMTGIDGLIGDPDRSFINIPCIIPVNG
jgi:hypothetical protein